MKKSFLLLVLILSFLYSVDLFPQTREIISSVNAPKAIGPYSQAVKSGNMLFLSGQIALDTAGKMHNHSIESETEQIFLNMKAILEEAGYKLSDVIKCTVFLRDINDFKAMNDIYGQYFNDSPPARSTIQVVRLPKDARIEIEAIAIKE